MHTDHPYSSHADTSTGKETDDEKIQNQVVNEEYKIWKK